MTTPRKHIAALALFWAALLPLFAAWLRLDQVTAPWDMSGHAKSAYRAWLSITNGNFGELWKLSDYYPPLFHLVAAPFTVFGSHPDVYCAANWLFLLVAMLGTWLLARTALEPEAALAAALILPAYAGVGAMCRMPMIDLALTATVVVTLWRLRRGMATTRQAHALGLCLGLGMLAKWSFAFFIAAPLLYCVVRSYKEDERAWRVRLVRLGCLAAWPLVLAGPWYLHAAPGILKRVPAQLGGEVARKEGDPAVVSLQSITRYAVSFHRDYAGWPLIALGIAGLGALTLGFCARNSAGDVRAWNVYGGDSWKLMALSLGSGYLILTLIANKDPRYIMPLVPIAAIVSTAWMDLPPISRTKRWFAPGTALLVIMAGAYGLTGWNTFIRSPPNRQDMKVEAVAEWIARHRSGGRRTRVLVIPNDWHVNATALDYALYRRNCRCQARPANGQLTDVEFARFDFLVIKEPPGLDEPMAPHATVNSEVSKSLPDWTRRAAFERGDGVHLIVLGRTR